MVPSANNQVFLAITKSKPDFKAKKYQNMTMIVDCRFLD